MGRVHQTNLRSLPSWKLQSVKGDERRKTIKIVTQTDLAANFGKLLEVRKVYFFWGGGIR